ncbi:hypothetical protein ACFRJ1_16950 [Streptomyces sp. NPDC056773]|uniref:hypothetical protein n=1 Tax=unclassified Streptomyces TaxID=2593676 RepID=UPI0020B7CAF3|nr:hypothetical protein [Streptomyces sp. TBY4]MCP3755748.1 hypothetical protein [Streptomyces sp. TBY4]
MGRASKVKNHDEAKRWLAEGKSYAWMVQKYQEKYETETTPSYWAVYKNRAGLPLRIARDNDLIPWKVEQPHRWAYDLVMLRFEARRRAVEQGDTNLKPLSDYDETRLSSWKRGLAEANAVVYYDPTTEDGFFLVPREESDTDIVRAIRPGDPAKPRSTDK